MQSRFDFRPWVRRAGVSMLAVALLMTGVVLVAQFVGGSRRGWASEPAVWAYLAILWIGALRVFLGTRWPVVEMDDAGMTVRPLHTLRFHRVPWNDLLGTERMVPGDRLIIYYGSRSAMKYVALNLNLVRGRRKFETDLDRKLLDDGFKERFVDRSRYLSKAADGVKDEKERISWEKSNGKSMN